MPHEAFQAKIDTGYYLKKAGHPSINVLLVRQAILVKGPGMKHSYFCFWHNDEFPLGEVFQPVTIGTICTWQGFNHTSCTLAFNHAKLIAGWETCSLELPWTPSLKQSSKTDKTLEQPLLDPDPEAMDAGKYDPSGKYVQSICSRMMT